MQKRSDLTFAIPRCVKFDIPNIDTCYNLKVTIIDWLGENQVILEKGADHVCTCDVFWQSVCDMEDSAQVHRTELFVNVL